MKTTRPTRLIALTLLFALLATAGPRADYQVAMQAFQARDFEKAIQEMTIEVKIVPEYYFGWLIIGLSHKELKQYPEAIENLETAKRMDKEKFAPYYNLGAIYFTQKKYGQAITELEAGEALMEKDAQAKSRFGQQFYRIRGRSHAVEKNYGQAIADLKKLAKRKFDDALLLGLSYYGQGEWSRASTYLKEALGVKEDPRARRYLVNAMSAGATGAGNKQQAFRAALAEARKWTQAEPKNPDAWMLQGNTAMGAKNYTLAEESFRRLRTLKPKDCKAQFNLGQVLMPQKRFQDAIKELTPALACLSGEQKRSAYIFRGTAKEALAKKRADGIKAAPTPLSVPPEGDISTCEAIVAELPRFEKAQTDLDKSIGPMEQAITAREKVLPAYQEVLQDYQAADRIKPASQVAQVEQIIGNFQDQIGTIKSNISATRQNIEAVKERINFLKLQRELKCGG